MIKNKWKIGAGLTERDQLDVLRVLSENNDRFAYTIEEISRYQGPAMEINQISQKQIFRPPHKLGEKDLTFLGEECVKLKKIGFIRISDQSKYASATVDVRKKDGDGNDTDFRKCVLGLCAYEYRWANQRVRWYEEISQMTNTSVSKC